MTYSQEIQACNAASDGIIISETACTIPAATLRLPPFSLSNGSAVVA
jgi:hypothetical protein